MKYLRLLVVVVVLLAGGYALWQFAGPSPAETSDQPMETKAAPAPTPAPAVKPATIAPPKAAGPVAPPVSAPAPKPVASVAQPAATTTKFDLKNPQPQADLNDCLEQSLQLLEAKDVLGLVKTLMPPQVLQQMIQAGQVASMEDAAVMYSSRADLQQRMSQLQTVMESAKGQTPEMNADGTEATFKGDPTANGPSRGGDLVLVKVDGFWYLK